MDHLFSITDPLFDQRHGLSPGRVSKGETRRFELNPQNLVIVADVRSRPFSRLPWFCRPSLEKEFKENGIRYVFLGQELGARRDERDCYIGERADYERIAQSPTLNNPKPPPP